MLFRYVHAELHGASSTVIKNHKPELSVPPLTLNQAGCFTVSGFIHNLSWVELCDYDVECVKDRPLNVIR